jgi:hypothetical protein
MHKLPFGRGLSRVSLYELMAFFNLEVVQEKQYLSSPRVDVEAIEELERLVRNHLFDDAKR